MIGDLPHRGRWALLRAVLERGPRRAVALARFDLDHVEGHFPGDPVVPGALLLEAMAQTQLLLEGALGTGTPRLAGYDRVRFLEPVVPPATVRVTVELRGRLGSLLQCDGFIESGSVRVCEARVTGTFTGEAR